MVGVLGSQLALPCSRVDQEAVVIKWLTTQCGKPIAKAPLSVSSYLRVAGVLGLKLARQPQTQRRHTYFQAWANIEETPCSPIQTASHDNRWRATHWQ